MNTQELRNKIDSILGNSMRVLLPSYWWKRLFHHVADALDSKGQGVSIVESEKDLKKLDVPEGSIASVVGDAEWKSFDECYQPPANAGDEALLLCTRIPLLNVSDAPITIEASPLIMLADITSINSIPRVMYVGIDNKGVAAVILRNPTGSLEIEGLFNLRAADSTVVNKAALNQLNSALASGRFLFIGYEADSSDTETEEEQIAVLNSIFSWAESIGGVFRKGVSWDRLAMANEIPYISGSTGGGTNITVDSSLSTTSTNPVQNKVVTNALNNKQTTLVSGGNIKTINNQSILGSGNLVIETGSNITIDSAMSSTSVNPVQNKVIKAYVDDKIAETPGVSVDSELSDTSENAVQNKAITAALNEKVGKSDIKTINGVSLLGSGDITISGGVSEDYVNTAIANAITTTLNTAV